MKKISNIEGKSKEPLIKSNDVIIKEKFFDKRKFEINCAAILLSCIFGWLQLSSYQTLLKADIDDQLLDVFLNIIIVIYFTSWILGMSSDLKFQEMSVVQVPKTYYQNNIRTKKYENSDVKLPIISYLLMVSHVIVFGALCYFLGSYPIFFIIFLAFLSLNYIGMNHINKILTVNIENNRKICRKYPNPFIELRTDILEDYSKGKWQKKRFIFGFITLIVIMLLVQFNIIIILTNLLNLKSPRLVIEILIFSFVVLFEYWIWQHRYRRNVLNDALDDLKNKYNLTLKRSG